MRGPGAGQRITAPTDGPTPEPIEEPAREPRRAATQKDVAALAGISVSTVSYVASGRRNRKTSATPDVTARVLAAVAELQYRPQRAGRVLQRRRTDLVAVRRLHPVQPVDVVPDRGDRGDREIEAAAEARGLGVVIVRFGRSPESTTRAEELLRDGTADAAIVLARPDFGPERLDRVASTVPTLAIGASLQRGPAARWDGLEHSWSLIPGTTP